MQDLNVRSKEIEIMDDLSCSGAVVDQTLHELEFINKWLGGNAVTLSAFHQLFKNMSRDSSYTVADLGCGGGDMVKLIHRYAVRNGFRFRLTGVDANPNIVEFARRNAAGIPDVTFESLNIFSEEFRKKKFDVVIGTLFFHHFTDDELIKFFRHLKSQIKVGIIINDIHRHPLAYHSIKMLTSWFSRSSMVRSDAPTSVKRAFKKSELTRILLDAGFNKFTIDWKWAFRWRVIVYFS